MKDTTHPNQAADSMCCCKVQSLQGGRAPRLLSSHMKAMCLRSGLLMVLLKPCTVRRKVREQPARLRRLASFAESARADDDAPTRHASHGCLCMRRYESARSFRPPGRLMFLRPVKSAAQIGQARRSYDAVWLAQEVIPLECQPLMSMSSLQRSQTAIMLHV